MDTPNPQIPLSLRATALEKINPVAYIQGGTTLGSAAGLKLLEPNDEQRSARNRILDWYENDESLEFRLGGYAGTGKTTLLKFIIQELSCSIAVCAFTGKAVNVLKRKGIPASTIHSLIYIIEVDPMTHEVSYTLKPRLECDLIIVDEASMVSTELYNHLRSFDKPILFVGDPGQLEPIGENPNLMREPDIVLTTIHRQALESPIIALATHVRQSNNPWLKIEQFGSKGEALMFVNKKLPAELLYSVDQVICGKNDTRQLVNAKFRSDKGWRAFDGLHSNEKLICTRNNRNLGVFNGMQMWVKEIVDEAALYFECRVALDDPDSAPVTLKLWSEPFWRPTTPQDRCPKECVQADFGYCITTHKAQGSEWDSLLVIDEKIYKTDFTRWRYTAITRAAKKLVYAT